MAPAQAQQQHDPKAVETEHGKRDGTHHGGYFNPFAPLSPMRQVIASHHTNRPFLMEICTIGGHKLDLTAFAHEFDIDGVDCSDGSSRVGSIRVASIVMAIAVALVVGLRMFARAYFLRKMFGEDGLILIASAFTVAFASVNVVAADSGLGEHLWNLPSINDIKNCIKFLYVGQVLSATALAFTKTSIIASYLRFITDSKFKIAMYTTGVVIVGSWLAGIFVTIFQCNPISGAWDNFSVHKATCIAFADYLYPSLSINVATDLVLCVLPWPYLWKLRMPCKQKIILCVLLSGGAAASVASILRLCYIKELRSVDVTYKCSSALIIGLVECTLGIICVSIPPLRPMVPCLFPSAMVTRSSTDESPLTDLSHGKRASMVREMDGPGRMEANGPCEAIKVPAEARTWNSECPGGSVTLYQSPTGQILAHPRGT